MTNTQVDIATQVALVRQRIDAACQRVGRSASEVTLIGVSKKNPLSAIQEAIDAGLHHFGESRIEEASEKIAALQAAGAASSSYHFHMIGHVQSRKAKDVVEQGFALVHSLDTLKLANRYSRFTPAESPLNVLLEINISGEATKSGWMAYNWEQDTDCRASLWQALREVASLPGLNLRGVMTLAPWYDDPAETRPVFRSLAKLREALKNDLDLPNLTELSMGMTDDFEVAVEEGATLVRIGRAIFGERPTT